MALANPIMLLIGGLLLTIPIVLHFLMQRKPKHIVFPALQFVRQRQSTNQKKLQLRHLLLLLLRCGLIAALAAAFAGLSAATNVAGAWTTIGVLGLVALLAAGLFAASLLIAKPPNPLLSVPLAIAAIVLIGITGWLTSKAISQGRDIVISSQREPVAAVLLFDNGPRMQYRYENLSRLEQAQQIGEWVIRQLPLESQVAIADCESPEPVFSVDIAAASKRMEALQHRFVPLPLAKQLESCFQLAASSEQQQREVYVFTDLSSGAWAGADQAALQRLREADDHTHMYVIDVGVEEPANFLLGELQIASQTGDSEAAVEIRTELARTGSAASRVVEVRLERQDPRLPVRRDEQTIVPESDVVNAAEFSVSANGRKQIMLPIAELSPGLHHGSVAVVGEDGLAVDDERFFSLQVRDRWQVLVVAPDGVYTDDFVEVLENNRAIDLEITVVRQSDFLETTIDDFAAIFILDPKPLDDVQLSELQRYVESGASVAMLLGNNAALDGQIAPGFSSEQALELIPAGLSNVWRVDASPTALNPTEFRHPVLRPMQGYATSIPWNEFPVSRFWGFSAGMPREDETTEVILRFGNGRAALIERRAGKGRLMLMTTPVTEPFRPDDRTRWNDLMIGGECWPTWWLIRNVSQYMLADQQERLNYLVGETAVLQNDSGTFPDQYQVFAPNNDPPQRIVAQENVVNWRFLHAPGVYRLKGRTKKGASETNTEPVNRGFSVNLPEEASDLTRITADAFNRILGEGDFQLARNQSEIQRKQGSVRQGHDFYPTFVLMLAALFGLESLMANLFYRSGK